MSNWRFKIKGDSNGKNGEAARFNQITAEGISECRRTQTRDLESSTTLIQDMSQDTHTETLHSDTLWRKRKSKIRNSVQKGRTGYRRGSSSRTYNRLPKHQQPHAKTQQYNSVRVQRDRNCRIRIPNVIKPSSKTEVN